MSIETYHPNYPSHEYKWRRIRDVIAGEDAVKEAGALYLPTLTEQTAQEYEAYKFRASWLSATDRTKSGLAGQIFRKDPEFNAPESEQMTALNNDSDLDGLTIYDYSRQVVDEVLTVGRAGTLVDWDDVEQRPFFTFYPAESIRDWRKERINGRTVLAYVALNEDFSVAAHERAHTTNEIGMDSKDLSNQDKEQSTGKSIRILRLVNGTSGDMDEEGELSGAAPFMSYMAEVWMEKSEAGKASSTNSGSQKSEWILVSTSIPEKRGVSLSFIPFVFHGPNSNGSSVHPEKAPLEDLVSLNLEHYATSADFKHGLHFAGLPTAWVAGFDKNTVLRVGGSTAWVSEDPQARAGYLEFTGQGLNPIANYLEALVRQMAVIGARLLENQKKEAETAESMTIRQGGESAVLQTITNSVGQQLTRAVQFAFWWSSVDASIDPMNIDDDEVNFSLNSDFISSKMLTQDVLNLTQAWIAGGISRQTLTHNLEQGEILPPGVTPDDEDALIMLEAPKMTESRTNPEKKGNGNEDGKGNENEDGDGGSGDE
jgi:hypothetical protein